MVTVMKHVYPHPSLGREESNKRRAVSNKEGSSLGLRALSSQLGPKGELTHVIYQESIAIWGWEIVFHQGEFKRYAEKLQGNCSFH